MTLLPQERAEVMTSVAQCILNSNPLKREALYFTTEQKHYFFETFNSFLFSNKNL